MIGSFSSLPLPVKLAVVVAGGGGLAGVLYALGGGQVLALLFVGVAVVAALLMLYSWVLKWAQKRKAKPLEANIRQNSSATPRTISEPARRARMDDLRRNFESGVEKFRSAGKNLYSLPWYLLVGEPGSGKTEAIRHCNVGFPPGLQDQLQGVGGTLNMNWWFTNYAVILDTAGRLMFEEVEPGATSEWDEFLNMLRTNRPNCPINGMLLVIPAESLIKDSAEDIERKGGKIAQQLDHIQRVLGVRFPVFVAVTKCDLINGFREFFLNLDDPQLQHQMLGWSNPAPLDQPFNPQLVEQHLEQVRQRLRRRRLGLLLDPVNSEDPAGRRVEQVDDLFAFPESIAKIGPRLRRYLEMIFVAGEWSAKPLFLRGIYFTSSMQEGSAMDAELAEALGVPVESLPEGPVWERQHSYFLRDLFLKKIFREQGLVTRASNTRSLQRRRKLTIMCFAIASVAALLLFTWFGAMQFNRSIGGQRARWVQAQRELGGVAQDQLTIVGKPYPTAKKFEYRGSNKLELADGAAPLAQFPALARQWAQAPITTPWIFRPVHWVFKKMSADFDGDRRQAVRVVFESKFVLPLIDAGREKLREQTPQTWSPAATNALAQILHIEAQYADGKPSDTQLVLLAPLFEFILADSPEQMQKLSTADRATLQDTLEWVYSTRGGAASWPPAALGLGLPASRDAVDAGVHAFIGYWGDYLAQTGTASSQLYAQLQQFTLALADYRQKEDLLLAVDDGFDPAADQPQFLGGYQEVASGWQARLESLQKAKEKLDKALAALGADRLEQTTSIEGLIEQVSSELLGRVETDYQVLLSEVASRGGNAGVAAVSPLAGGSAGTAAATPAAGEPGSPAARGADKNSDAADQALARQHLAQVSATLEKGRDQIRKLLREQLDKVKKDLQLYQLEFYAKSTPRLQEQNLRAYEARYAMFLVANELLAGKDEVPQVAQFKTAMDNLNVLLKQAAEQVEQSARLAPDSPRGKEAQGLCSFVRLSAQRHRKYQLLSGLLSAGPRSEQEVAKAIKEQADKLGDLVQPSIPLTAMRTAGAFAPEYRPEAALAFLDCWQQVETELVGNETQRPQVLELPALLKKYEAQRTILADYNNAYFRYWMETVPQQAALPAFDGWTAFHTELTRVRAASVNSALKDLAEKRTRALRALKPMDKQVAADLEKTFRRLQGELGTLLPGFDGACQRSLDNWLSLAEDPDKARATILELKPREFEGGYLEPYSEDPENPGIAYWNELCFSGLQLLSSHAESQAKQAVRTLLRDYKAFPLCVMANRQKMLTRQEVADAAALAQRINVILAESDNIKPSERTLALGAITRMTVRVNPELERLRGTNVLRREELSWFGRVKMVLDALGGRTPLTCKLLILPAADQSTPPEMPGAAALGQGTYRFRYFETGGKRMQTESPALAETGVDFEVPGLALALNFYYHNDDKDAAGVSALAAPWSAVAALHGPGVKLEKDSLGQYWKTPLVVQEGADKSYYYWVGLRFSRALPPPQEWPQERDWPEPAEEQWAPLPAAAPLTMPATTLPPAGGDRAGGGSDAAGNP